MADDSTRRSFLSLIAGAFAATTIAPASPAESCQRVTRAGIPDWVIGEALDQKERMDFWPWTVIDELTIEPNKPVDVDLFSEKGTWPRSLAIFSMGWAWREDTPLADCKQLLGTSAEEHFPGVWLRLSADGHDYWNGQALYVAGPRHLTFVDAPLSTQLATPIAAKSQFALNVSAPALPLTRPAKLQFYLCGVIAQDALAEWMLSARQ